MAHYPVDADGKLIAVIVDGDMPENAAGAADGPPQDALNDRWNGTAWMRDPAVAEAERRVGVVARILVLEEKQPRALREHALGLDGAAARLQQLNDQIAAVRAELTPEN